MSRLPIAHHPHDGREPLRPSTKEENGPDDARQAATRGRHDGSTLGRKGGTQMRTGDGRQIDTRGVQTTFDSTKRTSTASPTMAQEGRHQ